MEKDILKLRIKELREERNLSVADVAKDLGLQRSPFYHWNEENISLTNLEKLANYFHCSFDFLLGRSDEVLTFVPHTPLPNFGYRLAALFKEKKKSMYQFTYSTPIHYNHIKNWKEGVLPSVHSLILIADYLEITVDYLTGRDQ